MTDNSTWQKKHSNSLSSFHISVTILNLAGFLPAKIKPRIWKQIQKSVRNYWGKFSNQVFLWFQWRFVRTWTFVIFIPGWTSMRAAKKRSPEAPLPLLNVFTPILLQEILLQVFQLKIHASRIPKEDQRTWQLRQQFRNSRFRIGFRNFHQRPLRQHWPASTQKWSSLWLRQNRWNQNHDRYLKNKFLF